MSAETRPDENCLTWPDGSCTGEGCMHDTLPRHMDEVAAEDEQQRMRVFDTGATRNVDGTKLDYEGFLSPLVLKRYAEYLHKHRIQADGKIRASDNWQKGIPLDTYIKSGWRHFMDWWSGHRSAMTIHNEDFEDAICAVLFNASGYLHEHLKKGKF